ncbi:hypothetical protein [Sinorhizobium medicae]|uniref:hypothetical protein n=1 Tax=Sinorhizobium medicae TaxID=110321 RepID=UPI000FD7A529|nr:hypothetical protein [Sinorhizobium medicae]RVP48886.1 hypothetical protein CN078_24075 [Sinorhizobium medicae]RVP73674.1 hypothetical protein CN079_23825 [Sinorhizobium medicae]UWU12417.1 hypothetical protein N2598_30260 [Sinorhizobium medicae]
MPYPDIPLTVKQELASAPMRQQHDFWHLVRSRDNWAALSPEDQHSLNEAGWKAPRFEDEPGAGVDFLGMHREMIAHVNHLFHLAHDAKWSKVLGWDPIPWADDDPDWPVPPGWDDMHPAFADAKSAASVATMQSVASTLASEAYLRSKTLDQVGSDIEFSIHGWMHLRWSAEPTVALDSLDIANDWLGAPFSSHVNKHFWKLHGWIDARIADWERATGTTADLIAAWSGPAPMHAVQPHLETQRRISSMVVRPAFRVDEQKVQALSASPN